MKGKRQDSCGASTTERPTQDSLNKQSAAPTQANVTSRHQHSNSFGAVNSSVGSASRNVHQAQHSMTPADSKPQQAQLFLSPMTAKQGYHNSIMSMKDVGESFITVLQSSKA